LSPPPASALLPSQRAGTVVAPYPLPLRSYLELGALPTAVPCARLHTRQLVWEWGLTGLGATAELLVSELVTNAVQAMAGQGNQAAVRLRLSSDNAVPCRSVGCRPSAASTERSRSRRHTRRSRRRRARVVPSSCVECALELVSYPGTHRQSRLVLEADRRELFAVDGSAVERSLPRRAPRAQLVRPAEVMTDPDILRRTRDGLRNLYGS